jgi:hypothetical protein
MGDGDIRDRWGLPVPLPALPPDSQETLGAGGVREVTRKLREDETMAENPRPTTDWNQLMLMVLFIQIEHLTKTLKAYYDQHQATACECSLCKEAERAFRKSCMTEISAQFSGQ